MMRVLRRARPALLQMLAVCFFVSGTTAPRTHAQSGTPFLTGLHLDYLTHQSGLLYWKDTCLGAPPSIIQSVPAGGTGVATYFNPATCDGSSVRSVNIAVNSARRMFWVAGDGRILTLDGLATAGTLPVTLANMATPNASPSWVTISVSANYVYWAETFGELSESGAIYRAPIGGGARQLVFNLTQATGGGAVSVHALGNTNPLTFGESILYHRAFGRLARGTERLVLPGQDPWTETTVVNSIEYFKVLNGRIYYSETAAGAATVIRSRPITGAASPVTHATLSTAGGPRVTDIAADTSAVYWRELRSGTGPIWRQMLAGGAPEAITVNLPEINNDPLFLVSDGRALYWRSLPSEIRTLPVNAGAIVYDIEARAMEVVQTVQGPANDVPLVANKTTWVRSFGRFSVSGASTTRLERLSLTQLHGTRGGVALPGSPLQPAGGDSVLLTTDADRTLENAGSWFRLPLEWTTGTVVLRAEFNAERAVTETNFANNSSQISVSYQNAVPIHLKAYGLRTHQGTIDSFNPDYQPVIDLAEALLPTPELTISFGGVTMEEWNPPFPWDFGPYELSKSDDDSGWVLFKLGLRSVFTWASAGSTAHDMAFFRPFEERAFNGIGRLGNPRIFLSYMRLGAGASGFNTPLGGVTMAHEMGHNYDRYHVDCGGATDIDTGYPYNPCNIAGAVPYQGWNPISRRLIRGTAAGDLMSYRGNFGELGERWTSDYTWRAILNQLSSAPALQTPRGGASSLLLVGGVVNVNGVAELHPAIPLPDTRAEAAAAQLVSESDDATTWSFAVRRANGTLLATVPAGATHTTDNGPVLIHAVMNENPEAATVTLQKNSAPGIPQATLAGGGAPPVLAVTAPAAGAVAGASFIIRWTATDPEGQPLRFQVRHSNDHGATWRMLSDEVRENLLAIDTTTMPGGQQGDAQIEVMASDGLRTATARSAFFTIAAKAPVPLIVMESERGRSCGAALAIPAGEQITLRGSASDAEDSNIALAGLAWTVNGPNAFTRAGTGRELLLRDLAPGSYSAQLRATDSSAKIGTATEPFSVRPVSVPDAATAPVLDGYGDDAAYLACRHPLMLRYSDGTAASVRMVAFGGSLYVMMTGMPAGADSPGDFAGIIFDPDLSRDAAAQPSDRRFDVTRKGAMVSVSGDGLGGVASNPSVTGFSARVSSSGTRWNAEFFIPLSTLGVTAGQTIGMDAAHYWRSASGDDTHWFAGAIDSWNRPNQWAAVRLAADPDDPADADLDGMADAWEAANFGSSTGTGAADTDGDGQSDAMEYQAGTNPASSASRFIITGLVREGTSVRLNWPSAAGVVYDVETSSDLLEFSPFCAGLLGTGADLTCLINPALPNAGRFFRVAARRCPQ